MHGDGILIGYSENGYQGYTVGKNSVEQLETKYILKTLDFRGIPFNVEFYYCIKDGHLAVMSLLDRCEIRADISPINGSTDSVLVTLHYCDYNNDYNSFVYPLIMDLNTLSTTDFLSGCKISEIGIVTGITVNDSLSGAIAVTREGDLYYCDVKNPSINQIVSLEGNSLCSTGFIGFCSDDTALYIIYTLRGNGEAYNQSFYKYSISSNTIRKCCEFDSSSDKQLLYFSSNSVLLGDFDNTYSIVDIRTGVSTNIPHMQEDDTNPIILPSPDERYVLFGYCASNLFRLDVKRIYIYDTIAKETSILDLSDYKGMSFSILSWYDNSHITLLKQDITPDNAGSISPEDENESTLWIFDINRLK
jgi:hypothetical protein